MHNKSLLIKSAQEKLRNGKRLTKQEIAAVDDAQNEQAKARDLPYMRRMPKKDFIELFGGSSKVYIEWHKRWGFPWDPRRAHVDAIEALAWYRQFVADGPDTPRTPADDDAQRLKRAQADKAELELDLLRGDVIRVEELLPDIDYVAEPWKTVASVACKGCKQHLISAGEEAEQRINERFGE